MTHERKAPYTVPNLKEWGKIADLTGTGLTHPGDDVKAGSRPSQGQ